MATSEPVIIIENDNQKPSSAPPDIIQPTIDRKSLFRRSTGNKNNSNKAKMSSSSSLHSLVSILKPNDSDQRSVPNVSFGDKYNDMKAGNSKNSLSVNLNPSIGETSSQYQMECDESFRVPGGSFSTQTSTIGFRASFFSVLEKLGVWRSQDLYKASPNPPEARLPPERKTTRSSITSLYFRTIYGGKYINKVVELKAQLIPLSITTCCKAQCQALAVNLNAKTYLIDKRPFRSTSLSLHASRAARLIYACYFVYQAI
jgi:hypothetical protein